MFDLGEAVSDWRARLAATGTMFETDLDELESHLLDEIEALEEVGFTAAKGFRIATERLGETRTLASEFAKVNPILVWRASLFWIALGIFLVLALRPIQELAIHATVAGCMALHMNKLATTGATWAVAFASPLLFFGVLFRWVHTHEELPLALWAHSGIRIAAVVVCAVLMLLAVLGSDWGWLDWKERRWSGPMLRHAWSCVSDSSYALAVAAPAMLWLIALRNRALAIKNHASTAPPFWLALGLFVGCVRCELHVFVRPVAFLGAGLARLSPVQMENLMWILTLGCPLLLLAATYGYLRHLAPTPWVLLRAPRALGAMALSGAMGMAAVAATGNVMVRAYAMVSPDVRFDGYYAWLQGSIVTSCVLPIVVGTVMGFAGTRPAGARANRGDARPSLST